MGDWERTSQLDDDWKVVGGSCEVGKGGVSVKGGGGNCYDIDNYDTIYSDKCLLFIYCVYISLETCLKNYCIGRIH